MTTIHGRSNAAIVEGDDDVVAFGGKTDSNDRDTADIRTIQRAETNEFDAGSCAATFPRQSDEATGTVSGTTIAVFITSSRGNSETVC